MSFLSAGLGVVSAIKSKKATKKKNKKAQEALDKLYAQTAKTNEQGDYLQMLAQQLGKQGSDYQDAYGGGVTYDPETGTYYSTLSPEEEAAQSASYMEELRRLTLDQDQRRRQLSDAERMRGQASKEQDQALRDIAAFRGGVGQVDASKLAGQVATNRAQMVNAGYDDVAQAANTMSLRSGGDASDSLAGLARQRTRDLASLGDPTIEALTAAEQINAGRLQQRMGTYGIFNTAANKVYDAGFDPSTYAADQADTALKTQQLNQGWKDLQASTATNAAQTYLNTGELMNQGQGVYNKQYDPYGTARMWKDFGTTADSLSKEATGGDGKKSLKNIKFF